jgi:hypothetical protein
MVLYALGILEEADVFWPMDNRRAMIESRSSFEPSLRVWSPLNVSADRGSLAASTASKLLP